MKLIAINNTPEENERFINESSFRQTIEATIDFYTKVGFIPPWIGYYVENDNVIVGSAGFKGPPINNTVEIAYGTFEAYRQQGIGTLICGMLIDVALSAVPDIRITARTFSKENYSARILEKNNFKLSGLVYDAEDGEVWEWVYDT